VERASLGDVVLVGPLRQAINGLNPEIPAEARNEALRKTLRVGTTVSGARQPRLSPTPRKNVNA
jgi:type I restriction enzyme R subunit